MKYGVVVVKDTWNIGDDIQSYAAASLLPQVDYYIEREHLDVFRPTEDEPVNAIINGWLMNNKLGWPLSNCINPLYISLHFHIHDDLRIEEDFLSGIGGEDLRQHEPIGCRDFETQQLLERNGIKTWFSGCVTLTLKAKFPRHQGRPYVCLTDVSDEVVEYVKQQYPDLDIRIVEHEPKRFPALVMQTANWEERFRKVEELLALYQNARAVVTTRLHCAMPCLALGTPVLLLNDNDVIEAGRLEGLAQLTHRATTSDFIAGKVIFSLTSPPKNPEDFLLMQGNITQVVNKFVNETVVCTPEMQERFQRYDSEWEQRALWKNDILLRAKKRQTQYWHNLHQDMDSMEQGRQWLEKQYNSLRALVSEQREQLAKTESTLTKQCKKTENLESEIVLQKQQIADQQLLIVDQQNTIHNQQELLIDQQNTIHNQQELLIDQQNTIHNQQLLIAGYAERWWRKLKRHIKHRFQK